MISETGLRYYPGPSFRKEAAEQQVGLHGPPQQVDLLAHTQQVGLLV